MHCRNCGNTAHFVLLVECSVHARGEPPSFGRPDWTLSIECPVCSSTDVAGDPVDLLRARRRTGR